jgi:tetratricopeptide (TPR) repeat protein/CHAT domain-containing protein
MTHTSIQHRFFLLFVVLCLSVSPHAQEPVQLEASKAVERELAGDQSHTYQIPLTAGQFVRFRLDQRAIDVAMILSAPEGKQLVEMNLTGPGGQESLFLEAAVTGSYRLVVRGSGGAMVRGDYRLEMAVQATATALDRQRLTAQSLLIEANLLRAQGAKTAQQVIEKMQQARPLLGEIGETGWTAISLWLTGQAYGALSQPAKAIEYFEQALAIYSELKDRTGEASTLTSLGNVYTSLNRYEKAIEYREQALVIYRDLKNRASEASVLSSLGLASLELRHNEKAIEYFEQALVLHREMKNRSEEAFTINNLGVAFQRLGRYEEAFKYYEQALVLHREIKNRAGEGLALNNLGEVASALYRYDKAIEHKEQALAIFRDLKDRTKEAYTLYALGAAHYALGRYEKTKEYTEQALALFREMKNRVGEADALIGLSNGYWGLSQYEKDIEHREQALAIFREMKNRIGEADTLSMLGNAYGVLSRYEKAIEYFEQALVIHREMKNRTGEGFVLGALGSVYGALSRYEKSIEYTEKSLAISREIKDRNIELQALISLGSAYQSLSRHEQAIEQFEKALVISRETSDLYFEGATLSSLGDAYKSLSRYEQAIQAYEQALAIFSKMKNLQGEGFVRSALGDTYTRLSRYEQSIEHLDLALPRLREARDRAGEAEALYQLARAERGQSRLVAARTHIEESLKIGESLRTEQIISPESRAAFLANTQNRYQFYTELLMLQHRAEPTKGFDALALEISERQRARSLLDLLTEARAEVRQGVDAALLERERSLGRQLKDKAQRLLKANTPEQAAALKKEISQLENDYERAQVEIRKANPHYAALVQPQPLKFAELQQQLDADTLLLEYALGEEHSYVWAITRDSLKSYELPQGKEIEKTARQVHELLAARSTNKRGESAVQRRDRIAQAEAQLPAAAAVLSQMVLSPVAAELGNKRLVIVPDGALQYVPFAMLPQPSVVSGQLSVATNNGQRTTDNRQPLIVTHEIISLPSASALAVQRKELAGRQPAPKMLAVIADPVFTNTDERRKSADKPAIAEPSSGLADTRIIEQLAGESAGKGQLVIPRLPYTRQEAEQILALVPNAANLKAIDFKANYAITTSGELAQYRYLHFATHGLLDAERPGLSALVLSLVDEQGKPQDGFLRTNDIINLNLPAELVVLSACQTGLGQEIKGEGLVGITRGFMYAGAARVVVSLWSVNDRATAELMTKFYQKMLKAGQSPAAALRAAQVEMWKQKQWQAPYYWAAFVLQGEWK